MTHDPGVPPVAVNVLFLRVRSASEDTSLDHGRGREQLLAATQAAVLGWDRARRVVLDATDGVALIGDIGPLVALQAAQRAAREGSKSIAIALHHGPVRVTGEGIATRVVGDGIETASALAGFATDSPIVASRAFRDALAADVPAEAEKLRPTGEVVDERLRPHALHVFDPAAARRRTSRRNLLAGSGLLLLLGAGWAGRVARQRYAEARRPAVLLLDIRPTGEVFVDGETKGSAPPLLRLSLPPGPHTIEVRNGRLNPLKMDVHLQPGEQLELKHVFVAPPPPSPPPRKAKPPKPLTPGEKIERTIERYKFW
jgi:hypothetical protein